MISAECKIRRHAFPMIRCKRDRIHLRYTSVECDGILWILMERSGIGRRDWSITREKATWVALDEGYERSSARPEPTIGSVSWRNKNSFLLQPSIYFYFLQTTIIPEFMFIQILFKKYTSWLISFVQALFKVYDVWQNIPQFCLHL